MGFGLLADGATAKLGMGDFPAVGGYLGSCDVYWRGDANHSVRRNCDAENDDAVKAGTGLTRDLLDLPLSDLNRAACNCGIELVYLCRKLSRPFVYPGLQGSVETG